MSISSILAPITNTVGAPFVVAGTATRHAMDIDLAYGRPSARFNARDAYRTEYDGKRRLGAGLGVAAGTALPVAAGIAIAKNGLKIPGAPASLLGRTSAKVTAGVALGGMAVVGGMKMKQIIEDDGHLGAPIAGAGIVAGTLGGYKVGQKVAGKYAPIVGLGAAIAGGVAGYYGGRAIKVGPGHIGEHSENTTPTSTRGPGLVRDYARGAFNHFVEVGPISQGVSFAKPWGMREEYRKEYSNAERGGAMAGDLAAAGILGAGALAVAVPAFGGRTVQAADAAGKVLSRSPLLAGMQRMGSGGVAAAGAAALGIAGVSAWKVHGDVREATGSSGAAAVAAGAVGAATIGGGLLLAKTRAFSGMAAAPRTAASMLAAAALVGVASSVQAPVRQFFADAKDAHQLRSDKDLLVTGVATAAGAGIGIKTGLNVASKFVAKAPAGRQKAILAAGALVGAAALGAAGYGLSATMPDIRKVATSAGVGAAALGVGTLAVTRDVRRAALASAAGGALGIVASPMLGRHAPAPVPVVDTDAVA